MRHLLVLLVCLVCVPAALADGSTPPSPAVVAACQAEATHLGKDAFIAKYGPTEPFGHCYAAHTASEPATHTTTTTPTSTPPAPAAVAACQAEATHLGKDAFTAKYGPTEPFGHCYASHTTPANTPVHDDPVNDPAPPTPTSDHGNVNGNGKQAVAACTAEGLKLGKKHFALKYGSNEPFGTCVKQLLQKQKR